MVFLDRAFDLATRQNEIGIVQITIFDPWATDCDGRTIRACGCQILDRLDRIGVKRGLHHQILGVIACDKHFRKGNQIGALGLGHVPRLLRHRTIACDIAHGWIDLRKGNTELLCHNAFLFSFH